MDILEKRVNDLQSVLRVSSILADETRSLASRLEQAMNAILKVVGAETGSIMLLEKDELVVRATSNSKILGFKKNLNEPAVSTGVVQNGKMELRRWEGQNRPERDLSRYKSEFSVSIPLFASGNIIGVLNITDKKEAGDFSSDELEFLENFKKWVELILDNARLKRLVKENARKTTLDIERPAN